jgi:hypothetical protein
MSSNRWRRGTPVRESVAASGEAQRDRQGVQEIVFSAPVFRFAENRRVFEAMGHPMEQTVLGSCPSHDPLLMIP